MVELKLARLPERTPVSITFKAPPELDLALRQYAGLYRAAYGQAEAVADLIPFMLEAFLESDRAFAKARKEGAVETATTAPPGRGRQRVETPPAPPSISKED